MGEFAINFAVAFVTFLSACGMGLLCVLCIINLTESESIFAKIMWGVLFAAIPSAILALGVTFG